jgi:hypothetical protein
LTPIALAIEPRSQVDWSPSLTLLLLYLGIAGTGVACWAASPSAPRTAGAAIGRPA